MGYGWRQVGLGGWGCSLAADVTRQWTVSGRESDGAWLGRVRAVSRQFGRASDDQRRDQLRADETVAGGGDIRERSETRD